MDKYECLRTQKLLERYCKAYFAGFLCFSGFIGNIAILVVFYKGRHKCNTMSILLVALAMADTLWLLGYFVTQSYYNFRKKDGTYFTIFHIINLTNLTMFKLYCRLQMDWVTDPAPDLMPDRVPGWQSTWQTDWLTDCWPTDLLAD